MKHLLFKLLIIGVVTIGASVPLFAQTGNTWLEQWQRAKFGRPLPIAVAQQDVTRRSGPTTTAIVVPGNSWFENWYRNKYGRPSPLQQVNQRQPTKLSTANNQKQQNPVNTWFEQWYRDKYGRPSPLEESRLNPRIP